MPEFVQAAGRAVVSQLSWAGKVRIVQGIDKVLTGAGKMLPAACAFLALWVLTSAWPLLLYLVVVFFILDLPVTAPMSRKDGAAKAIG